MMRSVLPVLQDVGVRGCGSEYIDMWTRGCWKVSLKVYVYVSGRVRVCLFIVTILPHIQQPRTEDSCPIFHGMYHTKGVSK